MKKIIILVVVVIMVTLSYAQKRHSSKHSTSNTKNVEPSSSLMHFTCPMHSDIIFDHAGKCPKCGTNLIARNPEYIYVCPMHPNVVGHHAGKCSVCGMTMTPKKYNPNLITFTCALHRDLISYKPGVCPVCNKELIQKKE